MPAIDQVLTVAQMRAAEEALIAAGTRVDELMQRAGRGAAEWVWRIAAGRPVTVLCGPGNNGGDGYVIAEVIRQRGAPVQVIAVAEPKTPAARNARALYLGPVLGPEAAAEIHGEVLVDCLFGSGLVRPLTPDHLALLTRLALAHPRGIAVDLPSGIEADSGTALNPGLPDWTMTLALGAWKPAHFLLPGAATMGALRLVGIGCAAEPEAAGVVARLRLSPPSAQDHKYPRGLLAVVGGAMPGAARLSAMAGQGAGAGYVRLLAGAGAGAGQAAPDVVLDHRDPAEALADRRIGAVLVGPGLGRGDHARARLEAALGCGHPLVLDADALVLLRPGDLAAPAVCTPHEGELAVIERAYGLAGLGTRAERAQALAAASGMVVLAKGADSVIAAPDGRTLFAHRASPWLSVAGTGDVLAGIVAARLAAGRPPVEAAADGLWLHGEAARRAGPAFSAAQLARMVRSAYAACL
jgi:hydroxyethylthiazole kinase-like uncharacterized protein yjeF